MQILWIMKIFSNPSIYKSNTFFYSQVQVYLSVSSFSWSQLFQNLSLPFPSGRAALQACCMSVFHHENSFHSSPRFHCVSPVSPFFPFPGALISLETSLMSFWESFQNYWARAVLANQSLQDESTACICITHELKMVFTLLNGYKNKNKTKMYTDKILYNL